MHHAFVGLRSFSKMPKDLSEGKIFRQTNTTNRHAVKEAQTAIPGAKGVLEMLESTRGDTKVQSFDQYWLPLGLDYKELKEFCWGIASVMTGTSSVKSDFSLINWAKDASSQRMSDFSLELILHCKQYRQLQVGSSKTCLSRPKSRSKSRSKSFLRRL